MSNHKKRGTKNGVAIGFGRQKYKTALTCLYDVKSRDYDLKRMARETGTDYDVLRKWHREKLFLEQIEKNEDAFVVYFVAVIKEWHKKGWKQFQTHLKRPIKVITQTSNQYDSLAHMKELYDGLADAGFYSSSLSHKVTGAIFAEYVKAFEKKDRDMAWLFALRIIVGLLQKTKHAIEEVRKQNREVYRTMACLSLKMAEQALSMRSSPLGLRKILIYELNDLRRAIKDGLL